MISSKKQFSDKTLNAYIDGELSEEETDLICQTAKTDQDLYQRISDLELIKLSIQKSYSGLKPQQLSVKVKYHDLYLALAASVAAFALGIFLGWGWFTYGSQLDPANQVIAQAETSENPGVLFHINRNDSEHFKQVLNEIEALLNTSVYPINVRVVASGRGLSLFKSDNTSHSERIQRLKHLYPSQLVFAGCGTTYTAMTRNKETDIRLLPEVDLVQLGVLDLLQHQHQGWAYIQI